MSRYAISPQGAEAAKKLSEDIEDIYTELVQAGENLITSIAELEDGLGPYGSKIENLANDCKRSVEKYQDVFFCLSKSMLRVSRFIENQIRGLLFRNDLKCEVSPVAPNNPVSNTSSVAPSTGQKQRELGHTTELE